MMGDVSFCNAAVDGGRRLLALVEVAHFMRERR
jgi:hypothetical protein